MMSCSAYVMALPDVIRMMFSNPEHARYAGTRTKAMLDSPYYAHLNSAHNNAISALACSEAGSCTREGTPHAPESSGPESTGQGGQEAGADQEDQLEAVEDPDPSDEVMTGSGDTIVLLYAIFVDGVQLHQGNRETTTVISLKNLDLPGFLVGTKTASYNLAFISGPKEPTCLTDILALIVRQFKEFEPKMTPDAAGMVFGKRAGLCSPVYMIEKAVLI